MGWLFNCSWRLTTTPFFYRVFSCWNSAKSQYLIWYYKKFFVNFIYFIIFKKISCKPYNLFNHSVILIILWLYRSMLNLDDSSISPKYCRSEKWLSFLLQQLSQHWMRDCWTEIFHLLIKIIRYYLGSTISKMFFPKVWTKIILLSVKNSTMDLKGRYFVKYDQRLGKTFTKSENLKS